MPIHHFIAKETKQIKDSDGKHAEAEPDTEAKHDQDSPSSSQKVPLNINPYRFS